MENNPHNFTMESFKEKVSVIDSNHKQAYYYLKEMYDKSKQEVNKCNDILTDVYHIIELCDISWWGKIKMYRALFNTLKRRRDAKNMYTLAQCMFDRYKEIKTCQPNMNLSGAFVTKEKGFEVREYKFRALQIPNIKKGDEFKVDSSFEESIWK